MLIVGYGSIGEAVEQMLAPFDVTVERIARRARPGVSGLDDLPAALPRADIVVLLVPVTPATTGLVDARFLASCMMVPCSSTRPAAPSSIPARCSPSCNPGGCARRSTSPTPSRSRTAIRSGPRPASCSRRTSAGATTQAVPRAMAVVRDQLARYAAGEPLLNIVGPEGY